MGEIAQSRKGPTLQGGEFKFDPHILYTNVMPMVYFTTPALGMQRQGG